jgi:hypothetical protein
MAGNDLLLKMGVNYVRDHGQAIANNRLARKIIMNQAFKTAENGYRKHLENQTYPIGVCEDRYEMNKAII